MNAWFSIVTNAPFTGIFFLPGIWKENCSAPNTTEIHAEIRTLKDLTYLEGMDSIRLSEIWCTDTELRPYTRL